MKRYKKKKKKGVEYNVSTHHIMKVIMPCVMAACKDEFRIKDQEKLDKLAKRVQRYINSVANGTLSIEELSRFMTVVDTSKNSLELEKLKEKEKTNGNEY